jgi:hypothetical protein
MVEPSQVATAGTKTSLGEQPQHWRGVEGLRPCGHRLLAELAVPGVEVPTLGEVHATKRSIVMRTADPSRTEIDEIPAKSGFLTATGSPVGSPATGV